MSCGTPYSTYRKSKRVVETSFFRSPQLSLGAALLARGSVTVHIKQLFFRLECSSDIDSFRLLPLISRSTSINHSYHTPRSSVCLHRLTMTSALSGMCTGVFAPVSNKLTLKCLVGLLYTFNGKNIGNQLIMSLLFSSMVTGLVDNSVFPALPA